MSSAETVTAFWEGIDGRDWDAVGATLADDVVYEVPQTRERVRGRDAVVRFNAEYPGDWNLAITTLVASGDQAATTISFVSPGIPDATGIAFFRLDGSGRITHISDWWPEPYEPPADRAHLVERWVSTTNEGIDDAVAAAAAGLTPARLTDVLRGEGHEVTVTELGVTPIGTGQMGSSFRLVPTYVGPASALPATFVAKVPGGDPASRATAAGAYRTEVRFYERLASTVAIRVPHCHHAWATDDGADFLLLLEDLAPATQGDQLAGCTVVTATAAAANLAGLHGPRWCDASLSDPDGAGLAVVDAEQADLLADVLGPMTDVFVDRMGSRLAPDDRDVLALVPAVAGDWLLGRSERFAPVHGDYRLDNLMFSPDGTVTAVDWQTISLGLPARDLAFFCATSLTVDERRAHEGEVVSAYWDALLAHGVAGHPLEECLEDYRYALLQAPLIIVLGCAVAAPTERGDAMFLAMAERACAAIRDHDPFSLI